MKKPDLSLLTFALLLTAAGLWPTLQAPFFCWDDAAVPLGPLVTEFTSEGFWSLLGSSHAGLYHPATTLSFIADYHAGAGSPFLFHLTNLLIHLLNTALVYLFAKLILKAPWPAFWLSLLFGLHPMNVEAVAWITARKDLLAGMFYFSGLISWIFYLRNPHRKRFFWISLFLMMMACLSKIQAMIFLPALFCFDYLFRRRWSPRLFLEKIPFLLGLIILLYVNWSAQEGYGYSGYRIPFAWHERILNFLYGFSIYTFRAIIPFPSSVFYPFPFQPGAAGIMILGLHALVFLLFILLLIFATRRNFRTEALGLFLYGVNIVLVLGVSNFRETVIAERYLYLSSFGLFLAAISLLMRLQVLRKGRLILPVVAGIYVISSGILTFHRATQWKDPFRLLESALEYAPRNPIILNSMGSLAVDSGRVQESLVWFGEGLRADPSNADIHYNKAVAESKLGMTESAMAGFTEAIRLRRSYTDAWFGRGNLLRKTGRWEAAIRDYTVVISLDPGHFGAWNNRAIALGNTGNYEGALRDLDRAIGLKPDFAPAWFLRGIAKFETGGEGCSDLYTAVKMGYAPAREAYDHYCNPSARNN